MNEPLPVARVPGAEMTDPLSVPTVPVAEVPYPSTVSRVAVGIDMIKSSLCSPQATVFLIGRHTLKSNRSRNAGVLISPVGTKG